MVNQALIVLRLAKRDINPTRGHFQSLPARDAGRGSVRCRLRRGTEL